MKSTKGAVLPANFQKEMDAEIAEMQKRIGAAGGDQIKWTAGVGFTQADGSTGPHITGVILDFVSTNKYFDKPFVEGEPGAPACFAIGREPSLLAPSDTSPAKQSDTCGGCPQNEFGSSVNGKGKACRNYRLLALLPAGEEEGEIDPAEQPISVFQVPPTSLRAFDGYVSKLMAGHALPKQVVTRITTDATARFSNCGFVAVRQLTVPELQVYMGRVQEAYQRLVKEPDVSQYQAPKPRGRAPAATRR